MATRRMFSKDITNSDAFCDMPLTTQALYFHLGMNADDEGFLNNPKQIKRNIGASDDDRKILVSKGFIIPFESGVVALKHWYTHNQIRKDRFKPTICTKERNGLYLLEGREYVINAEEILVESSGLPNGNQMTTQGREEEMRIVQDRLGEYMYQLGNESLTKEQVHTLMDQYGKETVDSVIHRILSHPYYHCLNERKIAEWCEEEKNRVPAKKKIHGFEQRDYDFEELEKLLLAN